MYVHKELYSVHSPKALLWFRPVRAEVHVSFAAPPALSAYSHSSHSSVLSFVTLLAHGWCHQHQMEASLAPVPF